MKKITIHMDERKRISLTKVLKTDATTFHAYNEGTKIILEPIKEIPADEAWLFEPENKEILEQIKRGIKEKCSIKRGSFAKYLK